MTYNPRDIPTAFDPSLLQGQIDAMAANWPVGWTAIVGKPTAYAPSVHIHQIADIQGLQASLDSKLVTVSWTDVTGKPTTFSPASHAHPISDVTSLQTALDGKQPAGSYAPASHVTDTANPHAVTKAQVGLGSVDNTSDLNKPISTATQTALDGKLGVGLAVSTPSRVIGTAFQPHATKRVKVCYAIKVQATNPALAGNSSALVRLLSDASNPPTTERTRCEALSSVGIAVAVQITQANPSELTYEVPAGHWVLLSSTVSGTASATIVTQTEEVIG